MCREYDYHPNYIYLESEACTLKTLILVAIVVIVLLSTTFCSTLKGDSCLEIGLTKSVRNVTNSKTFLVVYLQSRFMQMLLIHVTDLWVVVLCVVSSIITDFIFAFFKRAR